MLDVVIITLIHIQNRPTGGLNEEKIRYAHELEPITKLSDVVRTIQPTVLIGI